MDIAGVYERRKKERGSFHHPLWASGENLPVPLSFEEYTEKTKTKMKFLKIADSLENPVSISENSKIVSSRISKSLLSGVIDSEEMMTDFLWRETKKQMGVFERCARSEILKSIDKNRKERKEGEWVVSGLKNTKELEDLRSRLATERDENRKLKFKNRSRERNFFLHVFDDEVEVAPVRGEWRELVSLEFKEPESGFLSLVETEEEEHSFLKLEMKIVVKHA